MKRFLVYGSVTLLLSMFLLGEVTLKWLFVSPDGISWLLRAVSQHTRVTLTARTVTGGLDSDLRLEGFSARWPEGELTIADLHLRCQPLVLPFGTLSVQELSLRGVRLRTTAPPGISEPEFIWPRLTGVPARFAAWIDHLTVEDFSYQDRSQPPVSLPDFSAAVAWRDSRVNVTNLSMATGHGLISGSVSAGFSIPALDSHVTFEPVKPVAGCSRFELRTRFQPGQSLEQVAGEVTVIALAGKMTRYTLNGTAGLTRKELKLHGVTLTEKGRRGSIQVAGTVALSGEARLRMTAADLDLAAETGEKTPLSGTVDLDVKSGRYSGRMHLASGGNGWRKTAINGHFQGDSAGAVLSDINSTVLGGTVRGGITVDWRDELKVSGALKGKGLDPTRLDPTWDGIVNFELDSFKAAWTEGRLKQGEVHGRLRESRLRGKMLSGEVSAALEDDDLSIHTLFLSGAGFEITAAGILSERLDVAARISDLSGLVPHARGKLELMGWGRYASGRFSGAVAGLGHELASAGVRIDSARLNGRLDAGVQRSVTAAAEMTGVTYRGVRADSASLNVAGSLDRHQVTLALRSGGDGIKAAASGGYADGIWQGQLTDFSVHGGGVPIRLAAPASLTISPRAVSITPLMLTGSPAERVEIAGQLLLQPLRGSAQAAWVGLDLARAGRWLVDTRVAGQSSGSLRLEVPSTGRPILNGTVSASGTVTQGPRTVTINRALLDLDAGERGTTATLECKTGEGVTVTGRFASHDPATLAIPSHGDLQASWSGLDASLAKRWLPQGIDLQGQISGEISGKILPEQRFDLNGTVTLTDGGGSWQEGGRELAATVRTAGLTWNWRGDSLTGALSLSLTKSGDARGSFQLPLPARFGATFDPAGRVKGTLNGRFHERGLLTTLFPGLIQESRGELEFNVLAGGTWQTPTMTGTVELAGAGAYLPAAGIRLTDIRMVARLVDDQVKIESFRMTSGSGSLEGTAVLSLAGKKLAGYRGTLHGERFQAVHLPELQLIVTPDLTFEGNLHTFSARGVIRIPEMLVNSLSSSAEIKPSRDVVLKGDGGAVAKPAATLLDLELQLLLGDKVVVKAQGLDARLGGEVTLRMTGPSSVTGRGEIRVVKGMYRIYGANLDIKRGRALFSGGAVERPTLDILALRTVDSVKAGVTVTGTPEAPLIRLYSEPALPDTDILSYIVLGRSMKESGNQNAALMEAAVLLTSSDTSPGLQEQIKQLVNLDTLTFSSGKDKSPGYKTIEPSLRSNTQSKTETGGVSDTMLQLGKYLTPKLYVSYGKSLFDNSQQFRARYSISKKWEVESKFSTTATGGDLYYLIELD